MPGHTAKLGLMETWLAKRQTKVSWSDKAKAEEKKKMLRLVETQVCSLL